MIQESFDYCDSNLDWYENIIVLFFTTCYQEQEHHITLLITHSVHLHSSSINIPVICTKLSFIFISIAQFHLHAPMQFLWCKDTNNQNVCTK